MPLTDEAKRAFLSESVNRTPIYLLTFEHDSFGAVRLCSNTVPIESRGNTYSPAPFMDVKLVPTQPNQTPMVEFAIGVNDQAIVASLRTVDESPAITLEIVLAESPNTVQKSVSNLRIEAVELAPLRIRMSLGVFPLFHVIGPRLGYTPDVAPGVFP